MIDQDEKIKLLNALTKGCEGMNHPQEDGSCPLDLRQGNTLHGALQIMIIGNEKVKQLDASNKGFVETNNSFPFDLRQGKMLHRALQIMNGEVDKEK